MWRSYGFLGFLHPVETKEVPRKKTRFHVMSLSLKFFIVGWYIVAGQKDAKADQKFGFLNKSCEVD